MNTIAFLAALLALSALTFAAPPTDDVAAALDVAAHAEDSPQRAYLQLICDIRDGRFEEATASIQPPPARFVGPLQESIRQLHALEALKARMRQDFGNDGTSDFAIGFFAEKKLRTIKAHVTGDTAVLAFDNEEGKSEPSTIRLHRTDGRWLVEWHGYVQGADPSMETMTDEAFAAFTKELSKLGTALQSITKRFDAGEFKSPQGVMLALMEEMSK